MIGLLVIETTGPRFNRNVRKGQMIMADQDLEQGVVDRFRQLDAAIEQVHSAYDRAVPTAEAESMKRHAARLRRDQRSNQTVMHNGANAIVCTVMAFECCGGRDG